MLPLVAVMLTGCSSSDDSSDSNNDGSPDTTPDTIPDTTPDTETSQPSPNPGPNPTVLNTFDGTYIQACELSDPEDLTEGSEVITIVIAGDVATSTSLNYTDTACAVPGIPAELVFEISAVYPGDTVETARGTADAVNLTVESVTVDGVQPSPAALAILDDTGAFDTNFGILLLEGSSLFSGDIDGDLDGTTPENRPTTLEDTPLIRQ